MGRATDDLLEFVEQQWGDHFEGFWQRSSKKYHSRIGRSP